MSISPGKQLGPYEILSPLGEGGMGEVWKARDTRLDRSVAIKFSKDEFSERFGREARAVAALNHPNICQLYDVGPDYLVMELVEGTPLQGPMPLDRAVEYAGQILDALDAAHKKRITHRDLKPANILVTKQGIKLLDFGLAKQAALLSETDATVVAGLSKNGEIAGTLQYMSPEQLQGKQADARSDIFSFGCVLYEMLSGKRAFDGDSAASVIAAVLEREPQPLQMSAPLDRILRTCLAKDPEDRFQNAHDLGLMLRNLPVASTTTTSIKRRSFNGWIAAAIAGSAAGGYFVASRRDSAEPVKYRRLTFRRGYISSARFASDGSTIIFAADWEGRGSKLYTVRTDSTESAALGIAALEVLSISSHGQLAIFHRPSMRMAPEPGSIATAAVLGGAERTIVENATYADWTRDGKELIIVRQEGQRSVIEWPMGKRVYETPGMIAPPRLSPDGSTLAIAERSPGMLGVWTLSVLKQSGEKRTIPGTWPLEHIRVEWSGADELWVEMGTYAATQLFGVTLDGKTRVIQNSLAPFRLMDVSARGQALIARQNWRVSVLGGSLADTVERDHSWLDASEVDDISPDGKTLLLTEYGEGGNVDQWSVYLRKTDGSPAIRLSDGQGCALSPDGKSAITLRRGSPPRIVIVPLGAGQPVVLPNKGFHDFRFATWTPDGKNIVFDAFEPAAGWRIWVVEMGGGNMRPLSPEGVHFELGQHTVSPDGKTVAAIGPDKKIRLYPLSGGEPAALPTELQPSELCRYSADGKSIFVKVESLSGNDVYRIDVTTGRATLFKQLRPADPIGVISVYCFHISRDEKTCFYNCTRSLSDLYLVETGRS